eukprot:Hpha_TRINITY_DN15778_c0_g4::TRINITY_DN15778_c0_g4_i2::g.40619::m.40619
MSLSDMTPDATLRPSDPTDCSVRRHSLTDCSGGDAWFSRKGGAGAWAPASCLAAASRGSMHGEDDMSPVSEGDELVALRVRVRTAAAEPIRPREIPRRTPAAVVEVDAASTFIEHDPPLDTCPAFLAPLHPTPGMPLDTGAVRPPVDRPLNTPGQASPLHLAPSPPPSPSPSPPRVASPCVRAREEFPSPGYACDATPPIRCGSLTAISPAPPREAPAVCPSPTL